MKKCYLLFLFIYPCLLLAQDYVPFTLDEGTAWQEVFFVGQGDTPGSEGGVTVGYSYTLQGDTLVDGLVYQKVYHQRNWRHQRTFIVQNDETVTIISENNIDDPATLIGFLRQDTLEQKVYYRSRLPRELSPQSCIEAYPPLDEDELLYDFSLELGDAVLHESILNTVVAIDTIVLADDLERERYFFDNSEHYWIEGIGSTLGLFGPWEAAPFESGCGFICYRENDELVLSNQPFIGYVPDYLDETCGALILSTSSLWTSEQLSIYPNPVSDRFLIDLAPELNPAKTQLRIFNSLGQLVLQESLYGHQHQVIASPLPDGMYYLVLDMLGEVVYTTKVLKVGSRD